MTASVLARHPRRSRGARALGPILVIGGLGAATLALHLRDPHSQGAWGMCPSAALGFWCPGCGGLRAVNDLTNGHLVDAASSNLLFVLALPFVVFALARWSIDELRDVRRITSPRVDAALPMIVLPALALFTLLRNLPMGSWLAP